MPCNDGGGNVRTEYIEIEHTGRMAARLCAVLTVLEKRGLLDEVVGMIDFKGAGVGPRDLSTWWAKHKRIDEEKREREQTQAQRERDRKAAIAKLSPKDRKVLGLK